MTLSFSWLKQIRREAKGYDTIPLTNSPPFPWEELASNLVNTFECEHFIIQSDAPTWMTKDELLDNLGAPLNSLVFTFPTLKGKLYWLLAEEEVTVLESLLLTKEVNPFTIPDNEFKQSFYKFLMLETLNAIHQTSYDRALIPIITDNPELPNEDSLCIDIVFTLYERPLHGRLVITPLLRKSFISYFSKKGPSSSALELANHLEVPLHLEIGRTQLSLEEWKKVSLGDFIILDRCSLNSKDLSGEVILRLQEKPIFKGELEGNQIKILEFPIIYEEDTNMAKFEDENDENDEDDLSDLEFDEDDDDLGVFDDFDDDLFKELDEEEDEDVNPSDENPASNEINEEDPPSQEEENRKEESTLQMSGKGGLLTPDQIPVNIIVELGSIKLTMDKLLQIEPGNLLDISIQPENGVDLTINGRIVAKAELIRIGENLGVRILELG